MTRLEALHVTSSPQTQRGAVTCLRGFRPWRLAARPCAAFRARSGGYAARPSPGPGRTVGAPERAGQGAPRPRTAAGARAPLGPNMGFRPAIFGNLRHAGVFIKAGILREDLTAPSSGCSLATAENKQLMLFTSSDDAAASPAPVTLR